MPGCCTPGRGDGHVAPAAPAQAVSVAPAQAVSASPDAATGPAGPASAGLLRVPGGEFLMGSEDPDAHPEDREGPVRAVAVAPFLLDPAAVSNARFAEFVEATGHVTDAERHGWSFVFAGFLAQRLAARLHAPIAAPWWRAAPGADWRHPEGPDSDVRSRGTHPVVHVSYADAVAFCAWAGCRLPTEREWELAARGGLEQRRFPWGDELCPGGRWRCNIWQGAFPDRDDAEDGYHGTAPVDAYEPNGFGLHNMVGNTWEWTRTGYVGAAAPPGTMRAIRGGSYLCHASYCNRYRVSARSGITPDSSTGNLGFRCARDVA